MNIWLHECLFEHQMIQQTKRKSYSNVPNTNQTKKKNW